jgi:hypothetical protein
MEYPDLPPSVVASRATPATLSCVIEEMKRLKVILALVFAVLLIALLFSLFSPKSSKYTPPRYILLTNPPVITAPVQIYSWGDPVVFQDGRFWVTLLTPISPTNSQRNFYLYDLKLRQVVSEVENGFPLFFSADRTKLLCSGSGPESLAESARSILSRITGGRLYLGPKPYREYFWILDLRNNTAVNAGGFAQFSGSGSRWVPAPGFRFGYNRPSTSAWGREFYVCDVDQQSLKKVDFTGDLLGWWDDHQILARDASSSFVAYDVQTGQTSNVFTAQTISQFLATSGLTNVPATYAATPEWNGRDYDWYFSADRKSGLDTNSTFLLKAEKSGPSLKLVQRDFQFHWLGRFEDSGTNYIYQGEPRVAGQGGDGSVYLVNLTNNVTRTIVPPWTSNQYALVRQTGDTLIYTSNRILWRVDLNTTNAELLFPPPPQK